MKEKISIGGQAVLEGVMMRGTEFLATAVRKDTGEIVYRKRKISSRKKEFYKMPFIRGIFMLFDSLVLGIQELTFSANQSGAEEEESLTQKEAILTTLISLALGIGLFIVLPSFIGGLVFSENKLYANVLEALIRLGGFVLYIWLLSFSKDIHRVFEYHGAEHKSIYAYENDVELTPENAKKFTTLHPRCGTSFLFIVMIVAIIVFSCIDFAVPTPETLWGKLALKLFLRVGLMPVIASLSYELQRYSSKHLNNFFVRLLSFPGLSLQRITTQEPDLSQLEVAIVAIKVSLGEKVENATEVLE